MVASERFEKVKGDYLKSSENNRVIEKTAHTFAGDYARGEQEYSNGKHLVRVVLENLDNEDANNDVFIGIISSNAVMDSMGNLYFKQTPSTYAWNTSALEWDGQIETIQNGSAVLIPKDRWPNAGVGDVLELTIDCDEGQIGIHNETTCARDTMDIDMNSASLPWKFIVIFSTRRDRVRLV